MIVIDIPPAWIPGRDSFIKLKLSPEKKKQYEHILLYAEIAASVMIWHTNRHEGFKPISYKDLVKLKSPRIIVQNPFGNLYQASRLMMGIRILMDLGLVENDKENQLIIIKEDILDYISIDKLVSYSSPCV